MSLTPKIIVTPLDATVCCTCEKWAGARVLLDGYCHSLADTIGYCQSTPDGSKKPIWQLPKRSGPDAACKNWNPTG